MHVPLENRLRHPADFRVKYYFYTADEGGRKTILPYQGYRSAFWYSHPEHKENQVFEIWPEFEDDKGQIVLNNHSSVNRAGTAQMWVIFPPMRNYHKDKIHVGLKGYFMEGIKKVAQCEVIEIVGLKTNPTEEKHAP